LSLKTTSSAKLTFFYTFSPPSFFLLYTDSLASFFSVIPNSFPYFTSTYYY
jgi:hypothetical protein